MTSTQASNSKSTRRALLASIMALLLCFSTLAGTTYAWFTDSASTGVNTIKAGNLDVQLLSTAKTGEITADTTDIFAKYNADQTKIDSTFSLSDADSSVLWEPGAEYDMIPMYVHNNGSLAAKYKLSLNAEGATANDDDMTLLDVLEFEIVSTTTTAGEGDAVTTSSTTYDSIDAFNAANASSVLSAGDNSATFTIKIKMPTTAGNEYQNLTIEKIWVSVDATQASEESDSYGNTYDKGAPLPWDGSVATTSFADKVNAVQNEEFKTIEISTAAELAAFAESVNSGNNYSEYTILLVNDLDLGGINWTPIGKVWQKSFAGTFDGQNHTIYNLTVQGTDIDAGLFGVINNASIKNLNFVNAYINNSISVTNGSFRTAVAVAAVRETATLYNISVDSSVIIANRQAGGIVGCINGGSIESCSVANTEITVTPNLTSGNKYDNGDKAGGIVGYAAGNSLSIENNTVKDCTLVAYRNCGGVVGAMDYNSESFTGNSVADSSVKYNGTNAYITDIQDTFGSIVGRGVYFDVSQISDSNIATNVTVQPQEE